MLPRALPTSIQQAACRRFGGIWNLAFFSAAVCTVVATAIGFIDCLDPAPHANGEAREITLFDIINQLYLIIFGLIMLVVDAPLDFSDRVANAKLTIYKYLRFMTLFTGRAIWYIFLGVMITGTLWDNFSSWIGFFFGAYVFGVGCASMFQGGSKSLKLERVRGRVNENIKKLAALVPATGMTKQQFGTMASELVEESNFSDEDLTIIVNALSFTVRADGVISRAEFAHWTRGSMTLL